MIRPVLGPGTASVHPPPSPIERLESRAKILADRYASTVIKGVPDVAKHFGGFVPFAGATEPLGASARASVIVGFSAGTAEARFMLNQTPATAAEISAAAGDAATFDKWMHSALFMADVRLKSAARRGRSS